MSVDEMIRPSLRLAFPLPPKGDAAEGRFRVLLDALSLRAQKRPPSNSADRSDPGRSRHKDAD
jgi:hypothetical protein